MIQTRNPYGTEHRPKPPCTVQKGLPGSGDLGEFLKFCRVDLRLSHRTAKNYNNHLRTYLAEAEFNTEAMRDFLAGIENPSSYNNWLKAFVAYGRYAGIEVRFRFSRVEPSVRIPPGKKDLRAFFGALSDDRERLAFVGFCCTGLRRRELLDLRMDQIDQGSRALFPSHNTLTKRSYITFYNEEFEDLLYPWLKLRFVKSDRLFPMRGVDRSFLFAEAQQRTGLHITPQDLRFWFANEMARLGVPDRFIDAFQGRVPRSVLARHYSDYSLENLKGIYNKANLKVLVNS